FGWFNLQVDSAVYIGYAILTIASTIGLIALLLEARIKQAARQVPIAVSALWLVLIAAAFANYQLYLDAWQGRLLFPALAPICVFLALGLSRLPWGHTQPLVIATFVGISLTVTAAMPFRYIGPAYAE